MGMSDAELDWGRAVLVGAIAGGAFWALAVFAFVQSRGSASTVIIGGAAAVAVILVGLVILRRATGARVHSLALGAVLAPLTGVAAAVPFCVVALAVELTSRVAS